jgi:butyrate kinase
MGEDFCVLAIKTEFLQTKIAVYKQGSLIFLKTIVHPEAELAVFKENTDQYEFRGMAIWNELINADIETHSIKIIMARGGLLKPIPSGIYEVNEAMKLDLHRSPFGRHSVNIGGLIADWLTNKIAGSKAYIADPAVVDELEEIARYTGFPEVKRQSIFHALNHKYVARRFSQSTRRAYEDLNLIVAHLGDGISIGAHKNGKVVDVNQCFDGEGPFSLERAGSIPMADLVKICFSGKYSEEQILTMIRNEGGLFAYCGTSSYYELEKAEAEKNRKILIIFEAMAYQVSKYIGYMAPVFNAPVDAILITGILANNKWFTSLISSRVKIFAPVHIFPGEDVLDALAMNAYLLLKGDAHASIYA